MRNSTVWNILVFFVYHQLRPAVRTADFQRFSFSENPFSHYSISIFINPSRPEVHEEIILEISFQKRFFLSERGAGPEIFRRAPRAGGGEIHGFHIVHKVFRTPCNPIAE